MNTQIRTLAQLQEEKQKLKMQMEVSKREFIHSFGYTKTQAKDFLIKKVALPAGALGLATIGISKLTSTNSTDTNNGMMRRENSFFLKMMPIVLPMIQAYLSTSSKKVSLPAFLENMITSKKEKLVKKKEVNA